MTFPDIFHYFCDMKEKERLLEICADTVFNALTAQVAGAHRIELCTGLSEGGTTPSVAQIREARKSLRILLYVLIRPRGGDFLYSDLECEIMKADIHFCGQAGCDGVVIGMLRPNGTVDAERCRALIAVARQYGMGVTFHRAFDRSNDLFQAMEDVIALGCDRILTSGGYATAIEGADVIRQLIEKAAGRIVIMPGSGITPDNAGELIRTTGLKEMHGTFRSRKASAMQYKNAKMNRQKDEYSLMLADAEKIKAVLECMNNYCR
ncbi:MAG: copper homeostasis protein CutC [Dysgonamonadaceae bacterium]|jgi:copper homeostasis protein|nr:copper homeostasis protein CutC [Dysgonamonadaceae bacterium]